MTELEIKQKANDLAEAVRHAYITGALDNAKGDSEAFAEHYGCSSDTTQEELRPVLPGAAVYEGLSDSLALDFLATWTVIGAKGRCACPRWNAKTLCVHSADKIGKRLNGIESSICLVKTIRYDKP